MDVREALEQEETMEKAEVKVMKRISKGIWSEKLE